MNKLVAGLVVAGTTVLGATGLDAVGVGGADVDAALEPARAEVGTDTTPDELSEAFRKVAREAMPAVVYVEVEAVREARTSVPAPFEGTPWEDMFRRGEPEERERSGSGSGFIIREDGYILTNNHVVEGARSVTVVLRDRREFAAEVVGRDPNTDIAVLKIDASGLPVVEPGDSDAVEVGDWVVALGYPMHLGSTATAGIVSAKGRRLGLLRRDEEASAPLENFIQTDAAINPGNSGGPLVGLDGRVVGVNSAIASPTGYYSGYGFAVPMKLARRVAQDLIEHGAVRRPRLGVGIEDVDPVDAEVYGLDRPTGVEVVQVQSGSAAERAGIRLGDVIVGVDDEAIESSGELMALLASREPGETVTVEVIRHADRVRVPVELGAFEPAAERTADAADRRDGGSSLLGLTARELTPRLASRLEVDVDEGVVIVDVDEGGPAARAGLAPGMLIERVDGREIENGSDLERAVQEVDAGEAVSVVVRLPDGTRTVVNYRARS